MTLRLHLCLWRRGVANAILPTTHSGRFDVKRTAQRRSIQQKWNVAIRGDSTWRDGQETSRIACFWQEVIHVWLQHAFGR